MERLQTFENFPIWPLLTEMEVMQQHFLNWGVHISTPDNKNQVKDQITKTENSHRKQLELPRREKQDIQSQELNAFLLREIYTHSHAEPFPCE